jgi:hypothetical protein
MKVGGNKQSVSGMDNLAQAGAKSVKKSYALCKLWIRESGGDEILRRGRRSSQEPLSELWV